MASFFANLDGVWVPVDSDIMKCGKNYYSYVIRVAEFDNTFIAHGASKGSGYNFLAEGQSLEESLVQAKNNFDLILQ